MSERAEFVTEFAPLALLGTRGETRGIFETQDKAVVLQRPQDVLGVHLGAGDFECVREAYEVRVGEEGADGEAGRYSEIRI